MPYRPAYDTALAAEGKYTERRKFAGWDFAMAMFTIVMDYRGGTFIGQAQGCDSLHALESWARAVNPSDLNNMGQSGKPDLIRAVRENDPEPVEGVTNVWCSSGIVGGQLALIHVIQTQPPKKLK